MDSDPPPDNGAATTQWIKTLFRNADAMLAAATYDFDLLSEPLQLRLDCDLTASLATQIATTKVDLEHSFKESVSTFFSMLQQNVDDSTSALKRDVQMMD